MNYSTLINMKYKKSKALIFLLLSSTIIVIYLLNKNSLDVYNTYAYYTNNSLLLNIPIESSDTLNNMEYIKINDEKYIVKELEIGPMLQNNYINYQEVKFMINEEFEENQVLKISIYYNNEKIIKKVKKIIFD